MFQLIGFLLPFLGTEGAAWCLLVFAIIVYAIYYVKRKQSYWKRKEIKYVEPKFLLGNIEVIRSKSFVENVQEIYNSFPKERYLGAYQFTAPVMVIRDPDLIKQVTIKEFDHFINHRTFTSAKSDEFWSKNLFASRDDRWRDLRATLSPSFTSSKMRIMFQLIDECAQQFVDYFKKEDGKVIELEMKETMRRYTNDVIATTAFGLRCNSLKNKNNDFYTMGKEATNFGGLKGLKFFVYAISPTLSELLNVKIIPKNVATFFSKIIKDTMNTRKEKRIVRPDMIHLLMEAQKGRHHEEDIKISEGFSSVSEFELGSSQRQRAITVEDICSQAFIFFIAGFDTVSIFLNFAFYEIAMNPDLQKRLREELETVDGKISYEVLLGLKYLDMFVSEVLRKWPPAVLLDREVTKEFTIQPERPDEKPITLEKGLNCWIPVFGIHRDEKFYPNPEKFDPERFNDENKHKINPSTYLPFGAGPRNCIGSRFALLEGKLLIYHVLRNFEIVQVSKTPNPMVLDKYQFNVAAKGGMWLGLKEINS